MPKRQPVPSIITPDEVMDSPALQGFDSFLRYRPAEELRRSATEIRPATAKSAANAGTYIPTGNSPTGFSRSTYSPTGNLPIGASAASAPSVIRPGRKPKRALRAQDGHSAGEQALYQALWDAAAAETADTRLIRVGYGGMQSLCGLDKSNCKDNILSLMEKLSVEVVSTYDIRRNEGNTYRIFSAAAVERRRSAAGMDWIVRSRGVRFVPWERK